MHALLIIVWSLLASPPAATIVPADWSPTTWHGVAGHPVQWRLGADGRIYERRAGDKARAHHVDRTNTVQAKLAAKVWAQWRPAIDFAHEVIGPTPRALTALIVTESQGDVDAGGIDPWENARGDTVRDGSWGLTQPLTHTAWTAARAVNWPTRRRDTVYHPLLEQWLLPHAPLPLGGDEAQWRKFLRDPLVNVTLGALVLRAFGQKWETRGDPLLTYAAYNSGGVRIGFNFVGLDATEAAVEAYRLFFNDAALLVP